MDNKQIIQEEFQRLKGQFVISARLVYRFIGLLEDDCDYYYILLNARHELEFHTCVGAIIPLKGFIEDSHYESLVRTEKMNCPTSPDFHLYRNLGHYEKANYILETVHGHAKEILKDPTHKLLSMLCWDVN